MKTWPPTILPILKCVTSGPSRGLRLITNPEVVCVSSFVVASVTIGVCAELVLVGAVVMLAFGRAAAMLWLLVEFVAAC